MNAKYSKFYNEIIDKILNSNRYEIFDSRVGGLVIIYDKRKHKYGIARCHPQDHFDYLIGACVAWCHLKGMKVSEIEECNKI